MPMPAVSPAKQLMERMPRTAVQLSVGDCEGVLPHERENLELRTVTVVHA